MVATPSRFSDGQNGQNGADGSTGKGGLNAGETPGLGVTLTPSAPTSGTFFAAGDKIVVTGTFTDKNGNPLAAADLATANLYMNGPRDVVKDKTAVGLLGCGTDRTKTPHHYIDLLTDANATWSGNTVTFTLNAITTEDPGTYTIGLYTVSKADALDQSFELSDVQILTDTVEPLITGTDKADGTGSCMDCHHGTNGKTYMHHIDPGHSPKGSPALDSVPVRTCLMCHNEDGYASIQVCADGSKAASGACADSSTPTYKVDPIIRRVHGVHNGANLLSKLSSQDFADYKELEFPADVKNCTSCHKDDAWKTKPTREACGACHDQVDWPTGNFVPARATSLRCTVDADCNSLSSTTGPKCDMTNASLVCANGNAPNSSNVCSDASTPVSKGYCDKTKHGGGGQTDDKDCMTCHGATKPADIAVAHKIDPPAFQYTVGITLSAPANGKDYEGSEAPVVTVTVKDAATGNTVDPNTFTEANKDTARFFVSGPRLDTVPVLTTQAAAAAAGTLTSGSYVYNDLSVRTNAANEDPKLTRSATAFKYNLDPVTGLEPGTYNVFFEVKSTSGSSATSVGLVNFQVGTATEEPMVATNCTNCHGDTRMHTSFPFNTDYCKNCHDYQAQLTSTSTNWVDGNRYGFGTTPIKRRVHGVHFGHYLNHPEQVHSASDAANWSAIVFPQDVRNCQTCHSASDDWKTGPDRVACLACHDSDSTVAHATLMTVDPTPASPYSGDEVESCESCHGEGKQFSVANVHNISDPYAPPYPRDADPASF